jgi:cell division septation protein DedD
MAQARIRIILMMTVTAAVLGACVNGGGLFGGDSDKVGGAQGAVPASISTGLGADIEAPEVFQATDQALWDGRPSLGGVWVASPDTRDPERVIIRNPTSGKKVIGALFRREIANPGPKLQISSDAAAALGILAGQPTSIIVTALRRDEAAVATAAASPAPDKSAVVETQTLDPVAGAAAKVEQPADVPTPAPVATGGQAIQIGIFSVEDNANRAAAMLEQAGLSAEVARGASQGKPLWSVISRGSAAEMSRIKALGFPDAYFLKR